VYFLITLVMIKKRMFESQTGSHNNLLALGDLHHSEEAKCGGAASGRKSRASAAESLPIV
jgi:hypothetical protein